MGRNFIITNRNTAKLGQRKKTVKREIVVGVNAIRFIALTIVAVLAVVYLSQSTAGASRSVKIRDFESQKNDLTLEKERLESEQTRLKSLREIDNNLDKTNLEQVTNIEH